MLFELILLLAIGLVFIALGLLIWKKERIDLIHSYHWDKLSPENRSAYAALMGKGMILIGAGMPVTGGIDFVTNTGWGWLVFGACFAAGLGLFIYAGSRYNRR